MSCYVTSLTKSQHVKLMLRFIAKVMMILSSRFTTIRTGKRSRNRDVLKPHCSLYGVSCSAPKPVSFSIPQGVSLFSFRAIISFGSRFAFWGLFIAVLDLFALWSLIVCLKAVLAPPLVSILGSFESVELAYRLCLFTLTALLGFHFHLTQKSLWQNPFCRQTKRVPEAVVPIIGVFSFRLASA